MRNDNNNYSTQDNSINNVDDDYENNNNTDNDQQHLGQQHKQCRRGLWEHHDNNNNINDNNNDSTTTTPSTIKTYLMAFDVASSISSEHIHKGRYFPKNAQQHEFKREVCQRNFTWLESRTHHLKFLAANEECPTKLVWLWLFSKNGFISKFTSRAGENRLMSQNMT